MKNFLLFVTAAVGMTAPLAAHADPAPLTAVPNHARHRTHTAIIVHTPRDRPTVYEITGDVATGSHIPTVIRRYHGRTEVLDGGFRTRTVYGAGAIGATGATDIGTALRAVGSEGRFRNRRAIVGEAAGGSGGRRVERSERIAGDIVARRITRELVLLRCSR